MSGYYSSLKILMLQEGVCATPSSVVGVTYWTGAEVTGAVKEGFGESIEGAGYDGQHEPGVVPHHG